MVWKPRKAELKNRQDKGRFWWELRACAYWDEFEKPKITYQEIQFHPSYALDEKGRYGNNKTFCGLMFLLAGLYKPGTPNFFRWQLAITYFGAGLNKLLDPDWHSGIFFENWAVNRLHQSWYIAINSRLPSFVLARFMCWSTIATELGRAFYATPIGPKG